MILNRFYDGEHEANPQPIESIKKPYREENKHAFVS